MNLPATTDADVSWAARALGLAEDAFSVQEGRDYGSEILKFNSQLDVAACPGSGKTTLLVAKLAVIARKWSSPHRGVCVLSHTNVARDEIADRLGQSGSALLQYPHFVGTIHGFVNEFMALPWLRSLGKPVRLIDDEACEQHRRKLLSQRHYSTLRAWVGNQERRQNMVAEWRLADLNGTIVKNGKPLFTNDESQSARQVRQLAQVCIADGYFCYSDMFMLASQLLAAHPNWPAIARQRFPFLFLDEVQDTSDEQEDLLRRVFFDGENPSVRQRFGDANQAIYTGDASPTSDFPTEAIRRNIANSHRFGAQIAALAEPFAADPQDLLGHGPDRAKISADTDGKHALFLFDEDAVESVLPVFAEHLADVFNETELRYGTFTAVGAVHKLTDKLCVPRYYPSYSAASSGPDPRPTSFVDCVARGQRQIDTTRDTHRGADSLAEGVLRMLQFEDPTRDVKPHRRRYRALVDLCERSASASSALRRSVDLFVLSDTEVNRESWERDGRPAVEELIAAIIGRPVSAESSKSFLEWPEVTNAQVAPTLAPRPDNVYSRRCATKDVRIRLGSIHSVKGQTHTATLVLDVDYYGAQWLALLPWLLGLKRGWDGKSSRIGRRLREHYVAMTRPTHLLCAAIRKAEISADELARLRQKWRVCHVFRNGHEWIA